MQSPVFSMTVTGWRGEDRQQARSFALEDMLFRPSDWSPAAPTATPIHMDILDRGGHVLRTLVV
jgi:hypothetical protein